jgi:2-polyprenyl-6-methoxyphenol hydroxylase-like FAD-dependent oxidoreductase
MLIENKAIAIVGGGPGGLTLARLLQLKGARVQVYERDLNKDVRVQGATLDLHEESGLAALQKAGLMNAFKASYRPGAEKTRVVDDNATIFYDEHAEEREETFGGKYFRPEIDRGPLRNLLLESLQPATIVWNSHFISMEKQNNGWLLHFKNRDDVYADLVIGADGANSKIRPWLTNITPFYTGVSALEGNIYNAKKTMPLIHSLLKGGKIFAYGNAQVLIVSSKGSSDVSFYTSFKTDESWTQNNGLDYSDKAQVLAWFKKYFSKWNNVWHELFENATTPFIPRPIYCIPLSQSWEALQNLTILGDAAHLMPPFAGEGVNMAMLDALELSECLTAGKYENLQNAISTYEVQMRKRAAEAAQMSLSNTEWMHSENALTTMLKMFSGEGNLEF